MLVAQLSCLIAWIENIICFEDKEIAVEIAISFINYQFAADTWFL
jgi:hypothetical protein